MMSISDDANVGCAQIDVASLGLPNKDEGNFNVMVMAPAGAGMSMLALSLVEKAAKVDGKSLRVMVVDHGPSMAMIADRMGSLAAPLPVYEGYDLNAGLDRQRTLPYYHAFNRHVFGGKKKTKG